MASMFDSCFGGIYNPSVVPFPFPYSLTVASPLRFETEKALCSSALVLRLELLCPGVWNLGLQGR